MNDSTHNVVSLPQSKWTFEDYTARKCSLSDVGHERHDPEFAKRVAQRHTSAAIQALADIALNAQADPSSRIKAATALLDRGWGKPTETIKADVQSTQFIVKYSNPNFNRAEGDPEFGRNAQGEWCMSATRLSYPGGPGEAVVENAPWREAQPEPQPLVSAARTLPATPGDPTPRKNKE